MTCWLSKLHTFFRDKADHVSKYEPVSIIEYRGRLNATGESGGHYICDLKDKKSQLWFRTNDNLQPFEIGSLNVTKKPVVVLYKKVNSS